MSSRDFSRWLRALLSRQHSMKATLLSWSAKANLPQDSQSLLGYHSLGSNLSTLSYSRDALAGPLRELEDLLQCVRDGRFLPDSTRSGRWVSTLPGDKPVAVKESPAFQRRTPPPPVAARRLCQTVRTVTNSRCTVRLTSWI